MPVQKKSGNLLNAPCTKIFCTNYENKNTRKNCSNEDYKEILYAFFYAINKPSGRNTTQGTYNIWQERTECTDTHLDPHKLTNVRRYIIKDNSLTEAENDYMKEQVVADIQWNETVSLEMNTVNNITDNILKIEQWLYENSSNLKWLQQIRE